MLRYPCYLLLFIVAHGPLRAEDGYRLWLRYEPVANVALRNAYRQQLGNWQVEGHSPTAQVIREELARALPVLLANTAQSTPTTTGTLLVARADHPALASMGAGNQLSAASPEGFLLTTVVLNGRPTTVITARSDIGLLYGVFHLLRMLQTEQSIERLSVLSTPRLQLRVLNHWDNLDRTVERGYAGFSLWDWHRLPDYIDPRYIDYARANASVGINGTVLTNVNANAWILTPQYLEKVKALADVFRPYGLKVYLTARFSAPVELGDLATADPLDENVQAWWKKRAALIYQYVPDFGGFLVKANSEGQPGPQNYGRSHADGANLLADAVAPFGGMVMWRAFVYDNNNPDDRAKQAYSDFKPLDGTFRQNVLVQVKNGPIDFQPREPFHPLFGSMPGTPLMMEFQITQEYLGFSTHLVYLGTLFKECLDANTHAPTPATTVAQIVDGSAERHTLSGMAGVANIGTDRNWCGHPFAQANWYAFGRLAWNHQLSAAQLAEEWVRTTFSNQREVVEALVPLMMQSRETTVNYMTPLGLHHIMGWSHHHGPAPWIKDKPRADWTSVYYHQADAQGIGFDRTSTGSNALAQYAPPVQSWFGNRTTCPDTYLLWFHHVPWSHRTQSGRPLWEALCLAYQQGVNEVRGMQRTWEQLQPFIDTERFQQVKMLLALQEKEAVTWRNACLLYFQTFSKLPFPAGVEKPDQTLEYYQKLEYPFAPGIRPKW